MEEKNVNTAANYLLRMQKLKTGNMLAINGNVNGIVKERIKSDILPTIRLIGNNGTRIMVRIGISGIRIIKKIIEPKKVNQK